MVQSIYGHKPIGHVEGKMQADIRSVLELEVALVSILKDLRNKIQADVVTFHYVDEIQDRIVCWRGTPSGENPEIRSVCIRR